MRRSDHRHPELEELIGKVQRAAGTATGDSDTTTVSLGEHETSHRSGGSDALLGTLDANARVEIRVNTTTIGTVRALNFTEGANVTLTPSTGSEVVNVVVAAAGGTGGGTPLVSVGDLLTHDGTGERRLPVASTGNVLMPDGSSLGVGWTQASIMATSGTTTGLAYGLLKNSSIQWGLQEATIVDTTGATTGNNYLVRKTGSAPDTWALQQHTTAAASTGSMDSRWSGYKAIVTRWGDGKAYAWHFDAANPTEIITASTDHISVLRAASSYVQTNGGGTLRLRDATTGASGFNTDAAWTLMAVKTTTSTGAADPITIVADAMVTAPNDAGPRKGTWLNWVGSTDANTYMVGGDDLHGCVFINLGLEGNDQVRRGFDISGRNVEFRHCIVSKVKPTANGRAWFIHNGDAQSSDRYVAVNLQHCRVEQDGGGHALYVQDNSTGTSATDGRLTDFRVNGANHSYLNIHEGGWLVDGGHVTNTAASTLGAYLNAGFIVVRGVYFDTAKSGPSIRINNNNVQVTGCFFDAAKITGSTPVIEIAGSDWCTIKDNTWAGSSGSQADNFVKWTGTAKGIVDGNQGKSESLSGAIASHTTDTGTYHYGNNFKQ